MEPRKPRSGDDPRQAQAGIRLILGEIHDLRQEMHADLVRMGEEAAKDREEAAKDREEAAKAREEAAKDREEAAKDRRRLGEIVERIAADATRDRRQISQALVVIGRVGRQILATQSKHTSILAKHTSILGQQTSLLRSILGHLKASGNSRGGDGGQ